MAGMVTRTMVMLALIAFLLPSVVRADGTSFPSRKASVVLPILAQFSSKDNSPKQTYDKIIKILGEPDLGTGGGPESEHWNDLYFELDDKTQIHVSFINDKLACITARIPGHELKTLYPK
jgi:hypothetical protein